MSGPGVQSIGARDVERLTWMTHRRGEPLTLVWPDPDHAAKLEIVHRALAETSPIRFRHHGIGVLQGYLSDDFLGPDGLQLLDMEALLHPGHAERETEARIHIWHPALEMEGMVDSGGIHDHRFDLDSSVLVGTIDHEVYALTPDPLGSHRIFTVVHARAVEGIDRAEAERGTPPVPFAPPLPEMVPGEGAQRASKAQMTITAGNRYLFPSGAFHRSHVPQLEGQSPFLWPVVSIVVKRRQRSVSARILAPVGTTPVHAFARTIEASTKLEILRLARAQVAAACLRVGP